jgi:energy-coupling factor transporter ATP-binding protein EcfA2
MKILRVAVRNFLGISDFEAELAPGLNVVRGANGSGKSSFLKAIFSALKSKKTGVSGPWVIHRTRDGSVQNGSGTDGGEGVAQILVELDGSYKVRRRIREDGTDLQVTKKEGPIDVAITSAAAFLSSLTPGNALNPVEFFQAPAAERRRILLSVVPATLTVQDVGEILREIGVDDITSRSVLAPFVETKIGLEELKAIDDALMDRRRAAWNQKEHHEEAAKAEAAKLPEGYAPEAVPDISEAMKRLDQANATVRELDRAKEMFLAAGRAVFAATDMEKRAKADVEELELRLESAKVKRSDAAAARLKMEEDRSTAQGLVREAGAKVIDDAPIKAEIAAYETRRARYAAWDATQMHGKSRDAFAESVRTLDTAMRQGIRTEAPAALWSRIEGGPLSELRIGMDGDSITVNGVALDNLSTSEQVRTALAIARATAGELKTICVDGFEALDPENRAAFVAAAADDGFQYVIAETTSGELEVGTPQ